VNKALKLLRELKSKPRYKDKYGNNVKQHFGIYKYFINTVTQAKEKFYISNECLKIPAERSHALAQKEAELLRQNKRHFLEQIQKVGVRSKDPGLLDYWGLPQGLCH